MVNGKFPVWLCIGLVLTFTACQAGANNQTPTSEPLPSPTVTVTVTASPIPSPTSTSTPEATATATPIIVGPTGLSENINPLTGLVVEDPTILNRRPVIIKVANFPRSGRPHAGLSLADVVFDYYIGEGANRFAAIYYGQDASLVGPIRSGRLVDAQLTNMFQAVLVFISADTNYVMPTLLEALGYRAMVPGPNSCPAVCDDGRHEVTSQFGNTAEITKWAARREVDTGVRFNIEGLAFDSRLPTLGNAATFLSVNYFSRNRAEWQFDPATGKYLRWIESIDADGNMSMIPLVDRVTNEQLAFDNVVIMIAEYTEYSSTLYDINVSGNNAGGRAILFRDGVAIEGRWRPYGTYRPMRFLTNDGQPLAFKPGTSWIYILGTHSTLDEPSPGIWEAKFYLP